MELALVSGMENAADYLHLWKAYIFYERRRIDWSRVDFEHPDDGILFYSTLYTADLSMYCTVYIIYPYFDVYILKLVSDFYLRLEDTKLAEEWRLLMDRAVRFLNETFGPRADADCSLLKYWARLEVLSMFTVNYVRVYHAVSICIYIHSRSRMAATHLVEIF